MGILAVVRGLILREHEQEHAAVDARIDEADRELNEMELRLRRLEIEKRLRGRRLGPSG